MELFDRPARLPRPVHAAVFGGLPAALAHHLDADEPAAAVQGLLDAGWRTGQLAGRIGALPAGPDPVADVLALLRRLGTAECPDRQWAQERQARLTLASSARAEEPASPASRDRWIREIRQQLGTPRAPRPVAAPRSRPACALCGGTGELFVTHAVRLCTGCVERLETGQLRWDATG